MGVAPIDHHWWYDRRLSTYDPASVGRTRVDSFNGTSVHMCTVSFSFSNLKSAKTHESRRVLLSRKIVYFGISKLILSFPYSFHILLLYFPLCTSTLYFLCDPFFSIDCT